MKKRILPLLPLALLLIAALCTPALALTESEVEAQVSATSKEAVAGNVLIWFLCAVAFLKVSQKIDSFMATMGVNVGHTGGSLLAEAMIAARGVSMLVKAGGCAIGNVGKAASGSGGGASSGSTGGFFKGGLIGMAGRHFTNSAVKTATTQTSAAYMMQDQFASATSTDSHTASAAQSHDAHSDYTIQQNGSASPGPAQPGGVNFGGPDAAHAPESSPAGTMGSDPAGVIQTENSVQSATFQSDSSVISGQDSASSETYSNSAVFADTMAQQEGVIITGHESQSAVHTDSRSPGGGTGSAGGEPTIVSPGGSSQVSQSSSSTQTVNTGGGGRVHTQASTAETTHTQSKIHTSRQTSIGGAVFARSLASGGKFANDVIGTVARGDIRSTGSITGDMAVQSLNSYMGYTALGAGAKNIPRYSDVEIGGGRIIGMEYKAGSKEGLAFGMYHAGQYTAPEGPYQKVHSADGSLWFKQYAQDAVQRKPYQAEDGKVAYEETIVKKLPQPPKRKDRI